VTKLRIILATPDFPPMAGGIQLLISRLVEHARWDTTVVCLTDDGTEAVDSPLAASVVRVSRLPKHAASVVHLTARTVSETRRRRPDAVIAGHIVLGPACLAAARLAGVPCVQYTHAMELGRRPGLTSRVLRRVDATIAVSDYTRDLVLAAGAPAERVHVVYPGSDASVSQEEWTDREPSIVTVARLEDRYKGFDVLLRALPLVTAQVPEVRWVVIGDGPLRSELEAIATAWGLGSHVEFLGAVDDAARDAVLARGSVFAMPSRVPAGRRNGEGFGIAYLEAGAAGLPVVAGAEGGATSAVVDGETGFLTDPRDHVAIADRIVRLLRDPALARRMGEAGRARQQTLTWERMAREVDAVVRATIEQRSG
jgi:phosphatidyl-myo-inositol dimannoside synthase